MMKVSMTVRIDEDVKALLQELAERDGRSMAGYLEWIIQREYEVWQNGVVSLESIDKKLESILNLISESKKRSVKPREKKETAVDAWEDVGVCTKESWIAWINHLRLSGKPINYYLAKKHFETLQLISEEDWNCDQLIKEIIEKGHASFYIPSDWKKSR